ncbi:hypothetical protein Y032_0012g1854 [Ancylostoma ceylanicum]|uniref:Uncharacterized protein n=1 Tax=Ancylostoma ceylanicum TaxID=53326 RepID=A0A016VCJ8_9BILA|nr:hypothetical protein Y032_0012g1854 [Ancylostoma ceylanicum]
MLGALHSASLHYAHYLVIKTWRSSPSRARRSAPPTGMLPALPGMVTISYPTVLGDRRTCNHRPICGDEMCRHIVSPP